MFSHVYRCPDGFCGSPDCATCYPGNDSQKDAEEAQAEAEIEAFEAFEEQKSYR